MKKHQRRRPPKKIVPGSLRAKKPMKVSRAAKARAWQQIVELAHLESEALSRCLQSKMPAKVFTEWQRLRLVTETTDGCKEARAAEEALIALENEFPFTEDDLKCTMAVIIQERRAAAT